jgi:hypothetical protein
MKIAFNIFIGQVDRVDFMCLKSIHSFSLFIGLRPMLMDYALSGLDGFGS